MASESIRTWRRRDHGPLVEFLEYDRSSWDAAIAAAERSLELPAVRRPCRPLSAELMMRGALPGDRVAEIVSQAAGEWFGL